MGADLAILGGEEICVAVSSSKKRVDPDTFEMSACTELFGKRASLISLPENDTETWDYVLTLVAV